MGGKKLEHGKALASTDEIEWETDVPAATHPLMLLNFVRVVAMATGVMGALVSLLLAITGEYGAILPLTELLAICGAGLFLLLVLVALIFYRNRIRMRFRIDRAGASASVINRNAKAASRVAIAAGLLAGRSAVAGTGAIALAGSSERIDWQIVGRARFYPRWHAITLANSWRTVLILFCRDDNYGAIATAVAKALDARPDDGMTRTSPLPSLLLRSALTVVATVPLFGLTHEAAMSAIGPVLALCFALATIWLLPLLAWVVIAVLVYMAAAVLGALASAASDEGFRSSYHALPALLGGAYLLWLSVAALSGRVRSGLMSD